MATDVQEGYITTRKVDDDTWLTYMSIKVDVSQFIMVSLGFDHG